MGLSGGELTGDDLSILADTRVNQLQVYDCPLGDISALSALTRLQYLALSNCGITDISPLTSLRKLQWGLALTENDIRDISPLGEMQWLGSITLSESEYYTKEDVEALMPSTRVTIEEPCTIEGHHHHM